MSARDRVTEVVRRYDDDAWIALANRGLLRRATKDLASVPVEVSGEDADAVTLAVGEREVRIPTDGPGSATCSCPSTVTCQHVLTACLWLALERSAPGSDPVDVVPDEPGAGDRLHEELMAYDDAALRAHAGLAGLRWAHQLLADLDALRDAVEVERGDYLTVRLPRPEVTLRYFGGGLDTWVLDQKVAQPARVVVAAVLGWQRAHGAEPAPPPPPRTSRSAAELGESKAESRARLRAAVAVLLADTVRTGVSHLSEGVLERYTTLAVWAQGAEYHRLALHLRRLADQVEQLLDRTARADDRRLLDDVVLARGLVEALDHAATAGLEAPSAIVGRARTTYDKVASLGLLGLGGTSWATGSGYHGVTLVFWAPDRGRFLTWTDARPESVPGFDPRGRWHQPGPWTAMESPSATVGRRVQLTAALVSPDSRISGVEATSARVSAVGGDELLAQLPVAETWAELLPRDRRRSLLAPPTADDRWAVARPAVYGAPSFDPNRQVLLWPLQDALGELLVAELPWSEHHAHAIARIEALAAVPEGSALVVRTRLGRSGLVAEPVSLVLPGPPGARTLGPVDALHFHPGQTAEQSRWLAAARASGSRPSAAADDPVPTTLRQLADLRSWLEEQAERGTSGADPRATAATLGRHHRELRTIGLHCFPAIDPEATVDPAELLLRSHYLVQQVERVLA